MSDPLDQLKQWRETTEKASEGPWTASAATHGNPADGPTFHAIRDAQGIIVAETEYEEHGWLDAELIALSRTAMPALLTAVENVLKLHHAGQHEECAYQEPEWRPQRCHYCGELWPCATVTAIRDALGGAK